MKKLALGIFATVLALGFTSCTSEAVDINAEVDAKLLESVKLQKDINGNFSVNYTTAANTTVQKPKSINTGSKEIYLFPGVATSKQNHNESLTLENNKLNVDFISNNNEKISFIVEDGNIILEKGQNIDFLKAYSLKSNEDGSYQLDFTVRDGINVAFSFNEAEGAYEIDLMQGKSSQTTFSKTFVKDANDLKIDFVNHLDSKESSRAQRPKRPRMVVVS